MPMPSDLVQEEKPDRIEPVVEEKKAEAPVIDIYEKGISDKEASLLITLDDEIIILEDEAPEMTVIDKAVDAEEQKEEVPEFEIPMLLEIADEIFAGEEPSAEVDSRDDDDASDGSEDEDSDKRRKRKKKKKRRSL